MSRSGKRTNPNGDSADSAAEPVGCRRSLPGIALAIALGVLVGCTEGDALSADEVLDNMLASLGNERARQNIQSLSATAEGSGPDGEFETTVTSIPPDTVYYRQASANGITEIWSTADRTWGGKAGQEYRPLGPEVREFVRGHEFHLTLLKVRNRFSDFTLQGAATIDGAKCLRIAMADDHGEEASLCIRTDDWLPAQLEFTPAQRSGTVQAVFDDWKSQGGLNFFQSLVVTERPGSTYSYEYVDISVNKFAHEIRVPPPTLPRRPADEVQ